MELVEHSPTLGFKILYRLTQLLNEKFSESLTEFRDQEKLIRLSKRATGQSG